MKPLERLFALEVEFHRRARAGASVPGEASGLHTSWALQSSYERLIGEAGRVSAADVQRLSERALSSADPRDVLAARDSVMRLLGIQQFGPQG